ncbi:MULTISPECIES: nucleotidyltransferase domain-containing protein [unclassified Streptomyces]|uniref:nucleotidyltransferase domain-containing protein n=1 Tax=unclassified Streptomyces TaxID=2593676 RepID=UPI000365ACCF|nr:MULTISPECIES: nucleotidyltransferase domain-containing protein [unclassified Streptomyces]MYT31892.1 nucleotidyltransferase [Streptomyces sp. SID8354]
MTSGGESGGKGLDQDGCFVREGSLERVPAPFAPVVAGLTDRLTGHFPPGRVLSAYLYGSIPRGTAVPGVSDLDALLVLRGDGPADADRAAARAVEAELDAAFPQIDGAGILLISEDRLLGEAERYDGAWFVACLCTPLSGPDVTAALPRYRPTSLLARETNGDLHRRLPGMRERAAAATAPEERARLTRGVTRHLVRTGFTLVMPRWNGWTSDLAESAAVFGHYYPAHAEQMRAAARAARDPAAYPGLLDDLLTGLAPWLADEYLAVHGAKALPPQGD